MNYFLKSRRAGFRLWTLDDLALAVSLWGDPEVTRFIDARGQLDADQVRQRLLKELATQETHGVQYWPAFLLEGGDFIGCCGLRPYQAEERIYELGFHIRRAYWSQGYATELARAVIEHAFGPLSLSALFAGHDPNNHASRQVLEKLGFRYTHDEFYPPTRSLHPSYLLRREA